MQAACWGPPVKLVLPQKTAQPLGAAKTPSVVAVVARKVPPNVPPINFRACRLDRPPANTFES